MITGLGCSGPFIAVTGYYDYYTGILLYLNVSRDAIIFMPFQAYTRLLSIEEVVKTPIRLGPIPPSELRAELVLVDTNISFERPVIGGVESGVDVLRVVMLTVAISVGVAASVKLITKGRSTK